MQAFVTSQIKKQISEITFGTEKSNSLPSEILEKLAQTILDEAAKNEVKLILLKSDGENVFCAGASFDELLEINDLETAKHFFECFAKVLNAMRTCGKIVVVRVQGKATGGGVGIVCAADYSFATKEASLVLPELNIGIGPFVIGPFVERKIGKSQFTAMSLDNEFRDANWGKENHIYHHVFDHISDMDTEIQKFLEKLSAKSADALALIKKISWEGSEHFDKLMPERILMSASLLLKDSTKAKIEKIKNSLGKKNG